MGTLVNDKECSVCLTEILGNYTDDGQKPKSLPCKHTFHTACIDLWIQTKPNAAGACPECRKDENGNTHEAPPQPSEDLLQPDTSTPYSHVLSVVMTYTNAAPHPTTNAEPRTRRCQCPRDCCCLCGFGITAAFQWFLASYLRSFLAFIGLAVFLFTTRCVVSCQPTPAETTTLIVLILLMIPLPSYKCCF